MTAPTLTYGITQKGPREVTFTLVAETESSTNAAFSKILLSLKPPQTRKNTPNNAKV